MLDDKDINKLLERYYNRFNRYNTEVLDQLGKVIKQFDGIKASDVHLLAQELKYNDTLINLVNKLSEITEMSIQDVYDTFDEVAKNNLEFAKVYYEARDEEYLPYKDNEELRRYVQSLAGQTSDFFNVINSRNIGFTQYNELTGTYEFKGLSKVYNDLIDEAVYAVSSGQKDYQSAMRKTINQLASSGVKVNEYKVGYGNYNRRLDSSVRQHVLDGLRDVNQGIQDKIGEKLGTNGVEISAHELCAIDHLPYQGRQYSKEEFEELQSELDRPIGEYNCKHFVYNIILGVENPSFSDKLLKQYEKTSTQKINYDGKTYNRYEATQVQRRLETEIRRQKDRQIMAKASGNNEIIGKAQNKISQLTQKYKDFSDKAGLDTYMNRLRVSGYRRTKIK